MDVRCRKLDGWAQGIGATHECIRDPEHPGDHTLRLRAEALEYFTQHVTVWRDALMPAYPAAVPRRSPLPPR